MFLTISLAGQTFRGGGTSGNYRQVFVSDANISACPHKRHLGAYHRDYHVILRRLKWPKWLSLWLDLWSDSDSVTATWKRQRLDSDRTVSGTGGTDRAALAFRHCQRLPTFFWCLFLDSPHVLLLFAASPMILNTAHTAKSFCPQCWTKMTGCQLQNFAKLPADACFQVCLSNGGLLGVYHTCIVHNQTQGRHDATVMSRKHVIFSVTDQFWLHNSHSIVPRKPGDSYQTSPPRNVWPARLSHNVQSVLQVERFAYLLELCVIIWLYV